jgi:hypothetical protein
LTAPGEITPLSASIDLLQVIIMTAPLHAYFKFTPNAATSLVSPSIKLATNNAAVAQGGNSTSTISTTPSNYIPGLYTLGMTYNVLNGRYADSKSAIQQVVNWPQSKSTAFIFLSPTFICDRIGNARTQTFGGNDYSVPEIVNFTRNTTSEYYSSYGKTTSEYTKSLSVHAGFEASYGGFSASGSTDYSESQSENLANSFTRVTYSVTHYNLSLSPTPQIQACLKPWFVQDLDTMDPMLLYRQYGTHLLRSLTVGGHAVFLYSTDTRSYHSDMSIEAAAKISASFAIASGSASLSTAQKSAMDSFNESSETKVVTSMLRFSIRCLRILMDFIEGGDPRYGNEEFLKNVEAWAASIIDYPESVAPRDISWRSMLISSSRFIDFGSLPCFTGIWEFATTQARRDELQSAYTQFVATYTADLGFPGPYVQARSDLDSAFAGPLKFPGMGIPGPNNNYIRIYFPASKFLV